jgi:AcrR family transcriptional regulator
LPAAGHEAGPDFDLSRRARVHKTTIYRRWKDRESLFADALIDQIAVDVPIPDTDAIETDLREHARSLIRSLTSEYGRAFLAAFFSDAARVPAMAAVKHRFFEDRFRRLEPLVTRAVERGELPPGTDPGQVIRALIAPIYLRQLVTAEPLDDAVADQAVRIALAAARAGGTLQGRQGRSARRSRRGLASGRPRDATRAHGGLVIGAGVIGTVYAGLLAAAGHDTSVLACGSPLDELRRVGERLRRSDGYELNSNVGLVDELPEAAVDLVIGLSPSLPNHKM